LEESHDPWGDECIKAYFHLEEEEFEGGEVVSEEDLADLEGELGVGENILVPTVFLRLLVITK
jgi:hypothetical protein